MIRTIEYKPELTAENSRKAHLNAVAQAWWGLGNPFQDTIYDGDNIDELHNMMEAAVGERWYINEKLSRTGFRHI